MVLLGGCASGLREGAATRSGGPLGAPGSLAPPGGTLAPYTVLGRTYRPLAEWRGFTEEGLASWYDHHGRSTANGERHDAGALTAAHTVLPMDACVRVENLENGRAVTVRINDRGPFVAGRVIDLTPTAARALGMLEAGLARVRVSAIGSADGQGRCPAAALSRLARAPGGARAPARRAGPVGSIR